MLNPAFEAFSGKLSDIQFSDTKYGPVAGKAATPNDPKTPAQRAQRGTLGRSSAFYGQLDPSHVELWRDYAKTLRFTDKKSGAKYTPDPIVAYNALADRWLALHGGQGTPPSSPPTASYPGMGLAITAAASGLKVRFSASAGTDSVTVVEFWLQRLPKATRLPSPGGYRVVGYAELDPADPTFEVTVKPGVYVAQYRYVNSLTGQATELVSIPVSGVALALEQGGAEAAPAGRRKAA